MVANDNTNNEKEKLEAELIELKKQVYRKQMVLDILKKAAEILKKDQGISQALLTNREKALLIDALKVKYIVSDLLIVLNISKSSYFYQRAAIEKGDKYKELRSIIKAIFTKNRSCYGYRRIHTAIKKQGITISEKVVQRIMKEECLIVNFKRKKKYNSYMGEISPAVDNVVARDFTAEAPNKKWLTDLTEFHIPVGKIYLSPVIDCFDGLVVSWTIGTSPNAELVNTMLDYAVSTIKEGDTPVLHSDRGAHYRWPQWIQKTMDAGIIRSMSKKGCSPDNSACEGFFGRLKNELFYGKSWVNVTVDEFVKELD